MKKYILKIKRYIAAQIFFDLLGVICLAISPLLQEWLFDYGMEHSWKEISTVILLYFILLVIYAVAQFFCMIFSFKGSIRFEMILKKQYFNNVFSMESTRFYEKSVGEYISIQGNDITSLWWDYLHPIVRIIRSVNRIIIYSLILFFCIDWRIAIAIITISACAIVILKLMGKNLIETRNTYQQQLAKYVTNIKDMLEGFHIINFVTISKIRQRHNDYLHDTADKNYAYGKRKSILVGTSELFTKVIRIVTFAIVAILFYKGEISVGVSVATLSYVTSFIEPMNKILHNITTIQSIKEVKEKILTTIKQNKTDNRNIKKHLDTGITFHDVTYTKENFSLNHLNFHIEKGKKYAIIGQSGAGKSTILKLLMGYEKPYSGEILIDGININRLDLSELVSYTDQREHIFRAGLWDNVTVFQSYSKQSVNKGINAVSTRFLSDITTRIDEKNCQNFSEGEQQVIAFLRMLARNSDVILMDEPFSAVDVDTRLAIINYLFYSKEFKDKTIIVVTHDIRNDNLMFYDKVIHVENTGVCIE